MGGTIIEYQARTDYLEGKAEGKMETLEDLVMLGMLTRDEAMQYLASTNASDMQSSS